MEDALRLREELDALRKEIISKKKIKDDLDVTVNNLHKEIIKYGDDIPSYKDQTDKSIMAYATAVAKLNELNLKVSDSQNKLNKILELSVAESKALEDLRETQKKIIKETAEITEKIKQRHEDLNNRESISDKKEKELLSNEIIQKTREELLLKREVEVLKKERELVNVDVDLQNRVSIHQVIVEDHNKKVDAFIQKKKFHIEDESLLNNKLAKADKLMKDNIDIKAGLLIQGKKLEKEISVVQSKQVSLDRSIADLKNQENRLKIMELRIKKLATDSGLEKELKELEESLK